MAKRSNKNIRGWSDFSRFNDEQSLGEVIKRISSTGLMADKFTEIEIVKVYETLVGKTIARMTDKLYVRNGILYIVTSSPSLKQELSLAKSKLIFEINQKIKDRQITDLKIF